ncbi:hypothetical protein KL906_000428 [Ogataea polymorpha]|nr:hypothetical protein KL908_000426 [Ogataea polymorpha]KAG7912224.1 hypothetical protein KL906_000428 [Ogataea polymorpha]
MTLVAGRHLAVASPDPSKTAETISYICNLWGFKEQTRTLNLEPSISFEDLAPLLHSKLAVVLFVNLEFTDSKFQQELASYIDVHHGGRLSMVSVIANRNNIEVSLKQSLEKLIWLREVHRGEVPETDNAPSCSASQELETYRSRAKKVKIVREIKTYIYDIVVFTRMHRMVVAGLPTSTWKDMELFVQIYAAIHDMDYVTPAMVKLAAAKVIPSGR